MKLQFLVCILFIPILSFSQSWDYINFTPSSSGDITNACIDEEDNIYAIGRDDRRIKKITPAGFVEWEKNASALLAAQPSTWLGGIEYADDYIYTVGHNSPASNGVIVRTGTDAADLPNIWDEINSSPSTSNCIINDIKVKDNYLYVVGTFGLANISHSITFFDGTTLSASRPSTFIAKYSMLPFKELLWAKKVTSFSVYSSVRGANIDVDELDNVFVSGRFSKEAMFFDGDTPYVFGSSHDEMTDAFLAKFDENGDFDPVFSLKTSDAGLDYKQHKSHDVIIGEANEAVFWAENDNVIAYEKDGSGSLLWSRSIDGTLTYSIEENSCGDVYITGQRVNSSRDVCGRDFFAQMLNSDDGSTVWESNATSCMSYGAEVLIDANKKEIILGSYDANGTSETLIIDDVYNSSSYNGYFVGRYDDDAVNNCCKNTAQIDLPTHIKMCDDDFEELCGPLSTFPSPMYTYEWQGPSGEILSTSRCFTPTSAGSYTLVVTDENGCVTTHHISITLFSPYVPPLSDVKWCPDDLVYPLLGWLSDPFAHHPCAPDYQWTYEGTVIEGATGPLVPFMGAGTYCVQVSFGLFSVTRCFDLIECCEPNTQFSMYWQHNDDGSFSLSLENVSTDSYVEETYLLEKDCNNDGLPGPWEVVESITRTEFFDEVVVFDNLDPNCFYRVTHRVPSPCKMKVYVHTEYIGGKPGMPNGGGQKLKDSYSGDQDIAIYPNPVGDIAQLFIKDIEGVYEISIYNMQGQLVKSLKTASINTAINLNDLSTGTYIVKASNGVDNFSKRIVKM